MGENRKSQWRLSRRRFLRDSVLTTGGLVAASSLASPAIVLADSLRPKITHGLQSGDLSSSGGMIWSRADRPSRMLVEVATSDSFQNARQVVGPAALEQNDFAAKMMLRDLPADQDIFYRVRFQDLQDINVESEPSIGHFRTAPAGRRDINFVWSGDTAGQGWGINPDWGGMKIYAKMLEQQPDFFIHSGDTIYADGPIEAQKETPDGKIWKNITLDEKAKNAETLREFRGNYKYNLMDEHLRAFNAEVPMFAQWDDHETVNNWYPQEVLAREDYKVKSVGLLSARAKRAFLEFMPLGTPSEDPERIYRAINYGPSLDMFFLDMRTYRGRNTANRQPTSGPDTVFLGNDQIRWLKQQLLASKATWKVIASDMPIGMMVRDGETDFENLANGDGPPLGRELEMANLLSFMKHSGIENLVWLTADVHYTAAHYYDPDKAQFADFSPFWEFVSGPLNAGTFGPSDMDNTFGPQVVFSKAPPPGQANLPPSMGLQFFGQVRIDGASEVMTVDLKDLEGEVLYSVNLDPVV